MIRSKNTISRHARLMLLMQNQVALYHRLKHQREFMFEKPIPVSDDYGIVGVKLYSETHPEYVILRKLKPDEESKDIYFSLELLSDDVLDIINDFLVKDLKDKASQ